ncbi:c-type cytochrome [Candidatus Sulfidibacterium hydrothermale]|uniref:c-type cytochrome n=1 Tax=Candidatus Sulfidibacterium hydrothermale TaxID=2875962 RepID=UPI001F0B154C|nr:c-type cytochrome [Candidatus Sulfidibacterium hydrothermale]UBM61769.1 c-type cytochrome [Candidatus Sulfidibacterium hydrothermale]
MKKLFVLIFMVAMGGFLLSSCGGNAQKGEKSTAAVKKAKTEKTYVANLENGKKVYNKVCIACHMTGVAGAPALKDKARWTEIAAKGLKQLHHDAISGFTGKYGVMPARGSCTDCSDQDLYDAVAYMLKTAGVTAK